MWNRTANLDLFGHDDTKAFLHMHLITEPEKYTHRQLDYVAITEEKSTLA